MGAVHVEPDSPRLAEAREVLQRVDGPGGGGPRAAHHRQDPAAPGLGVVQGRFQGLRAHAVALVGGHRDDVAPAQPQHLGGAAHGIVGLVRGHQAQVHGRAVPLFPHVVGQGGLARRQQRREVAGAAAVGEDAPRPGRVVARQAREPRHEAAFHGRGHGPHLVDGGAVVQEVPHHAQDRGEGQGRRALVPHVARVLQVVGILEHPPDDLQGIGPAPGGEVRGPGQEGRRRFAPGQHRRRAALDLGEVVGQGVHGAVAERSEGFGIVGVVGHGSILPPPGANRQPPGATQGQGGCPCITRPRDGTWKPDYRAQGPQEI